MDILNFQAIKRFSGPNNNETSTDLDLITANLGPSKSDTSK
jgi:hypothetical protein